MALAENPDLAGPKQRIQMEMLAAVLGGEGLGRVAELAATAAGAPVVIIAPRMGGPWTAPPDEIDPALRMALERYVAERPDASGAAAPQLLAAEVSIAHEGDMLGAVLLLKTDGAVHPETRELLRFAAVAALTENAIIEARDEGEQRLRGSLLEQLRDQRELDRADVLRRAAKMGVDLRRGGIALCARIQADQAREVLALVVREHPGALAEYLSAETPGWPPRLHVLIGTTDDGVDGATRARARRLAVRIGRHGTVGMSSLCADPGDLGRAMQEAELMLDLLLQSDCETPAGQAMPSMGTYRLLLRVLVSDPEEIRTFFEETIAPLVHYDDQYRTQLLLTLRAYLSNNCNMNATAESLFAHRHTVAYRLDRIQELTGLDPRQAEHREQLGLGLKAYKIIQSRLHR